MVHQSGQAYQHLIVLKLFFLQQRLNSSQHPLEGRLKRETSLQIYFLMNIKMSIYTFGPHQRAQKQTDLLLVQSGLIEEFKSPWGIYRLAFDQTQEGKFFLL